MSVLRKIETRCSKFIAAGLVRTFEEEFAWAEAKAMHVELLTNEQMAEVDRLAVRAGVDSLALMESAGSAVAAVACEMSESGATVTVLCGPGNNGGDGFVVARLLSQRGYKVRLALFGDRGKLKGDAATMASRWTGEIGDFDASIVGGADLIIDAVFGAGLTKAIESDWVGAPVLRAVNDASAPVLAVDVPSGVNGTSGQVLGMSIQAERTVTFFRRKPGHLLYPGAGLCGVLRLADIGIASSVLGQLEGTAAGGVTTFVNHPCLWRAAFPVLEAGAHKYTRGHALAVSGPDCASGAGRLAARGALRVGAGLVTVSSPKSAVAANAAHLTEVMLVPFDGAVGLASILEDRRKNALIIGPGCGIGVETRKMVHAVLSSGASCVLDADALTSFAGVLDELNDAIFKDQSRPVVLTPHEGEFARLFGDVAGSLSASKLDRARMAARKSGAVVVLKGADSVVASPDGRVSINENAPSCLATAGSGDVLAGMIGGLLAQGMAAFEAASAAVWLHGACGARVGRGLIASDLPEALPAVLQEL